ncbi:hypothetical protein JMUB5695_02035 [Mycobacterium heckeshornense]|nr:hypothetical protein JMUB5695_02035 [Mycobacterium heckeshornense]
MRFGLLARWLVDPAWQVVQERADDRHVGGADRAGALPGGDGSQPRLQGLAGQRATLPEVFGFPDPPRRLGATDPEPISQRMRDFAADLGRDGFVADPVDQLMTRHRQAPRFSLQPIQQLEALAGC